MQIVPNNPIEINGSYVVNDVNGFGFVITHNQSQILVLTYEKVGLNDIVKIEGIADFLESKIDSEYIPYLKSEKIFLVLENSEFKLEGESINLRNQIQNYFLSGNTNYHRFFSLLLLGKRSTQNADIYQAGIELNIAYLFAISGFHISIFYKVLQLFFRPFRISEKYYFWIILIILVGYLIILNFPLSASRAVLYLGFSIFNKHYLKKFFSRLEIICFVMIIFLLINPYEIYSYSFIFSFSSVIVISFLLEFNFKSNFLKALMIGIVLYLFNLPFNIHLNAGFSIYGLLFNLFVTPIFTIFYIVSLPFAFFSEIGNYIWTIFYYFISFLRNFNHIVFVKFSFDLIRTIYAIIFASSLLTFTLFKYSSTKFI